MQIISTVAELRQCLRGETSIAFVPTMGNLYQGHLDLVRIARQHGQCVVVSIFVNPLQFGANEDFGKYPRTLQADCAKLEQCGVEMVFTPTERELYPQPQQVTVEPPLANELCGAFRPGHFRGVATVVLKLLNIVQPQVAVFGKKDYQQLYVIPFPNINASNFTPPTVRPELVEGFIGKACMVRQAHHERVKLLLFLSGNGMIRQVAAQLNLPVEIIGGETVRAPVTGSISKRRVWLKECSKSHAPAILKRPSIFL